MVREIDVPAEQAFTPTVTVRLDQRATDAVLAGLLGIDRRAGQRPPDRRHVRRRLVGHRRRPGHGLDHPVRPGGRLDARRAGRGPDCPS